MKAARTKIKLLKNENVRIQQAKTPPHPRNKKSEELPQIQLITPPINDDQFS